MRNHFIKLILVSSVFISSVSADESINYSLGGVRLGLSTAQAMEAMQSHFKIKNNQLILSPAISDPLTGIRMSKTIKYSTPEESIFVGFELANPEGVDPKLVVVLVDYRSKETEQGSLNFAVKEFGAPSDTSMSSVGVYMWCAQPIYGRCFWTKQNLAYDSKEFTLTDPVTTHKYYEAMVRKSASNSQKSQTR